MAISSVNQLSRLLKQAHHYRVTLTHPTDIEYAKRQLQGLTILTSWDEQYQVFLPQ